MIWFCSLGNIIISSDQERGLDDEGMREVLRSLYSYYWWSAFSSTRFTRVSKRLLDPSSIFSFSRVALNVSNYLCTGPFPEDKDLPCFLSMYSRRYCLRVILLLLPSILHKKIISKKNTVMLIIFTICRIINCIFFKYIIRLTLFVNHPRISAFELDLFSVHWWCFRVIPLHFPRTRVGWFCGCDYPPKNLKRLGWFCKWFYPSRSFCCGESCPHRLFSCRTRGRFLDLLFRHWWISLCMYHRWFWVPLRLFSSLLWICP